MSLARRAPLAFVFVSGLAACGGNGSSATDDAARVIDAAAAVDAAIDAAVDAAPAGGYVRQPPVTIPPEPPPPDYSHHPVDEQGRPMVAIGETLYLVPRPPDGLTALSACTSMIVRCVDPAVRGRSLDACVISPPRCATDTPWTEAAPCCAASCVDRYEERRVAGSPPITAFREAFYGRPACAPGVEALLGGAP